MRRKKYKIKFILVTFLFLIMCGVSYSYLETTLKIKGTVTGQYNNNGYIVDSKSNPFLKINNFTVNNWEEKNIYKYQYNFKVKNTGTIAFDNIYLDLTYNSAINDVNIWNYDYKINDKILNISSPNINLMPDNEIEVSVIVSTTNNKFKLDKIKLEVDSTLNEPEIGEVIVAFNKSNSWGNYTIQYNVIIKNETDKKIHAWTIEIPLEENVNYISGWNGKFNVNNKTLTIRNESYNGVIKIGSVVTLGLQLSASVDNYIPGNYKVIVR